MQQADESNTRSPADGAIATDAVQRPRIRLDFVGNILTGPSRYEPDGRDATSSPYERNADRLSTAARPSTPGYAAMLWRRDGVRLAGNNMAAGYPLGLRFPQLGSSWWQCRTAKPHSKDTALRSPAPLPQSGHKGPAGSKYAHEGAPCRRTADHECDAPDCDDGKRHGRYESMP